MGINPTQQIPAPLSSSDTVFNIIPYDEDPVFKLVMEDVPIPPSSRRSLESQSPKKPAQHGSLIYDLDKRVTHHSVKGSKENPVA